MVATIQPTQAQTNVIANGNLDSWSGGSPVGWQNGYANEDTEHARSGSCAYMSYSQNLKYVFASPIPIAEIDPDNFYVWINTVDDNPTAQCHIYITTDTFSDGYVAARDYVTNDGQYHKADLYAVLMSMVGASTEVREIMVGMSTGSFEDTYVDDFMLNTFTSNIPVFICGWENALAKNNAGWLASYPELYDPPQGGAWDWGNTFADYGWNTGSWQPVYESDPIPPTLSPRTGGASMGYVSANIESGNTDFYTLKEAIGFTLGETYALSVYVKVASFSVFEADDGHFVQLLAIDDESADGFQGEAVGMGIRDQGGIPYFVGAYSDGAGGYSVYDLSPVTFGSWTKLTIRFLVAESGTIEFGIDNILIQSLSVQTNLLYEIWSSFDNPLYGNLYATSTTITLNMDDLALLRAPDPLTPATTPSPTPTPVLHRLPYFDQNFYFHDQAITTNNVAGYLASPYQPTQDTYIESTALSNQSDLYYGVRIFHVQNRTTTELTNGSPQAQVHLDGTYNSSQVEELTATWSMPNRYLQFGRDALEFNLYVSFDGATWTPVAVYITDHIFSKQIFESEVTVHYYIEKIEGEATVANFYWGGGSGNYISGVYGFMLKTATPPDWQAYYLASGNLAMFVLAPYVVVLGNTFYGIVLLAFCMGIYIRYRNLSPVVLFVLLIVGTTVAGGVNIAFGEYVIGLIWAACAFALGLVYWRFFR